MNPLYQAAAKALPWTTRQLASSVSSSTRHSMMTLVGLPLSHQGQMNVDEVVGGAPYGATTVACGDGSRQPTAILMTIAVACDSPARK